MPQFVIGARRPSHNWLQPVWVRDAFVGDPPLSPARALGAITEMAEGRIVDVPQCEIAAGRRSHNDCNHRCTAPARPGALVVARAIKKTVQTLVCTGFLATPH